MGLIGCVKSFFGFNRFEEECPVKKKERYQKKLNYYFIESLETSDDSEFFFRYMKSLGYDFDFSKTYLFPHGKTTLDFINDIDNFEELFKKRGIDR